LQALQRTLDPGADAFVGKFGMIVKGRAGPAALKGKRPGEFSHRPPIIAVSRCQYIRGHLRSDFIGLLYADAAALQALDATNFGQAGVPGECGSGGSRSHNRKCSISAGYWRLDVFKRVAERRL
jgi:hypothetical protein